MSSRGKNATIIGVEYEPGSTLRFVTNLDSITRRNKAKRWTTGPKLNKESRRRNTTVCKGSCSICLDDTTVQKCPNSSKCTVLTCIDCIVQYCTTNSVCSCYSCKYKYTCIDIYKILGDRRTELLDIKYGHFVDIYDRYIEMTQKKIDISYEIQSEWQLTEDMGDALVFGIQPPEGTDLEWWAAIRSIWEQRTTHDALLKTNYVDMCSKCTGGIAADTMKCVRCFSTMCKQCGVCYESSHKCTKADIESRMEILKNSKCCPHCSARIHKIEGCDVMWCTVCKIRFRWDTLEILERRMHNPEHTAFIHSFYDGLELRMPGDFNTTAVITAYTYTGNRATAKYNSNTTVERIVVTNTRVYITDVLSLLIDLHSRLQENTDISPSNYEDERLNLVTDMWDKDRYILEMKSRARDCFLNRYYAFYIQHLIIDLIELMRSYVNNEGYADEVLYEQYCLKISGYNKDFCYIHSLFYPNSSRDDVLYSMLYNTDNTSAYYSVDTGVIIPHKYTIDDQSNFNRCRKTIRNILLSVT